jgi:hypothetical protein
VIPTLAGRIQTRVFLLLTVGLAWTIVAIPLINLVASAVPSVDTGSLSATYGAAILALIVVAFLGLGWELVYHAIQQYRWEKDWPILYALLEGIPEGLLAFLVVDALIPVGPSAFVFFCHFVSTWVVVWLTAVGPMRMVFLRWRFRGGRIL